MAYPKGAPHPKRVGDVTTAAVLMRLIDLYGTVLLPFGENQRYDLVVEIDERLVRVQCKTGRLRDGVIKFNACSSSYHHPGRDRTSGYNHSYKGQAEFFGVYCPQIDAVFLVPVDNVGVRLGTLRVAPTANSQQRGIRWASDYELRGSILKDGPRREIPGAGGWRMSTLFERGPRYAARCVVPRRVSSVAEPPTCNR